MTQQEKDSHENSTDDAGRIQSESQNSGQSMRGGQSQSSGGGSANPSTDNQQGSFGDVGGGQIAGTHGTEPEESDGSPKTGASSAGSQSATTGYGTGQAVGQNDVPDGKAEQTPSNSGNAGFQAGEGGNVSEERADQMSHADGSADEHDPAV